MSRGLRNNNPGNIRKDGTTWIGEKEPSTDKSFKQFKSIEYGYRAMFVLLGTYISRGWNTIEKIISKYAPPSENNTIGYINNVSILSGVGKNKTLSGRGCKEEFIKIVCAMSRIENGVEANEKAVRMGFELQNKLS